MGVAQGGQVCSFNYTTPDFVDGLFVQANIYDATAFPTLVLVHQIPMVNIIGTGGYVGAFAPTSGKTYYIQKLVYTDYTYETIATERSPGVDDIQGISINIDSLKSLINADIDSVVIDSEEVVGFVEDDEDVVGTVEDNEEID